MSLKEMLAIIDWEMGITPTKAMEYLDTLQNLRFIEYDVEIDYIIIPEAKNGGNISG
jgi:hypothetical protein